MVVEVNEIVNELVSLLERLIVGGRYTLYLLHPDVVLYFPTSGCSCLLSGFTLVQFIS